MELVYLLCEAQSKRTHTDLESAGLYNGKVVWRNNVIIYFLSIKNYLEDLLDFVLRLPVAESKPELIEIAREFNNESSM